MAQDGGSRRGGGLALLLSLAALALIALNFYGDIRQDQESDEVLAQLRSAFVAPSVIRKAEASVYYVEADNGMMATAFVVDRERGLLATNAHVAINYTGPGNMRVISVDGVKLKIESAFIHEGWNVFGKHIKSFQPALSHPATVQGKSVRFPYPIRLPPAYDVGLLQVSLEDAALLAPDIPMASREALSKLRGGDVIASIGYPGQMSSTERLDHIALTPKTTVGRIMAASSFVGTKLNGKSNGVIAQLIVHPLHTQPGTSGSPMINEKGEVIAVNQGAFQRTDGKGETARIEEVGERVGHRADILHDLLEDQDVTRVDDVYRPLWDEQLVQFEKMPESVVKLLAPFMSKPRAFESAEVSVRHMTFDVSAADPKYEEVQGQHTLTTELKLDPTRTNLVVATDYRGTAAGCNPNFQVLFPNNTGSFAQAFQTKLVRIYRLEIPAGQVQTDTLPIRFYEPKGCRSIGETMHLHVYSWAADDIVVADAGNWPSRTFSAVQAYFRQAINSTLEYLRG